MLYPWVLQSRIRCQKSSAHKQAPIVYAFESCMCLCMCVCIILSVKKKQASILLMHLCTCPSFFSCLMCNESASNHLSGQRQGFLWTKAKRTTAKWWTQKYMYVLQVSKIYSFKQGQDYHWVPLCSLHTSLKSTGEVAFASPPCQDLCLHDNITSLEVHKQCIQSACKKKCKKKVELFIKMYDIKISFSIDLFKHCPSIWNIYNLWCTRCIPLQLISSIEFSSTHTITQRNSATEEDRGAGRGKALVSCYLCSLINYN